MDKQQPNPASAKERADANRARRAVDEFDSRKDLDGKTDSGPEPDVFGRDMPPQD
jgi:hypothetical protein